MKFLKKKRVFKNEDHEKAWFIVTSSNVCKDMLRQFRRRHEVVLEDCELMPAAEKPSGRDLYMAVMDLPDKYKTVIYLYYYEGYKTAEIAGILHKPASTIRNRLAKARKMLKEVMGGNCDEE